MLIDPTNKVTQEGQILETHGIHWLKKNCCYITNQNRKVTKGGGKLG